MNWFCQAMSLFQMLVWPNLKRTILGMMGKRENNEIQDSNAKSSLLRAFAVQIVVWSKLTCLRLKNPFLSQLGRYKDRAITREVSFIPWMIPSSFLRHGPFGETQHRVMIRLQSHSGHSVLGKCLRLIKGHANKLTYSLTLFKTPIKRCNSEGGYTGVACIAVF